MTKAKIDPHVLDLREKQIEIANRIPQVFANKPHMSAADKERYINALPELIERINEAPLWHGHLSMIKRFLGKALLFASQIDSKPSVPMSNAYYGKYVGKTPRMILDATFTPDADKTLRRLALDDIRAICPEAGCGKFLLYRDKHGNVPKGRKKSDADCTHPRAIKARALALQAHRKEKTNTRKRDARCKERDAKKNPKPDPEYVKAMEKRKKALRDKEGAPSREERRKSRGF